MIFANSKSPRPNQSAIVTSSRFNGNGKAVGAFGEIIGQSRSWRQIIKQIEMVAPTDATVLILGETGTGKELIARELHRRSRRKDKPLVRVNCGCIQKELYESEFFGHARGAFTSAVKDRVGRFEAQQVEHCFWMRLEKSLWSCRANYCAFCRRNVMNVWERRKRGARMCGSSRPLIGI